MLTADEIIGEVVRRYSSYSSYKDQGLVTTVSDEIVLPMECPFKTLFARPSNFSFEFFTFHPYPELRHEKTRYVCGLYKDRAYFYSKDPSGVQDAEWNKKVDISISAAAGISAGASWLIGKLLFPTIPGHSLRDLKDICIEGEVLFHGLPCHLISGRSLDGYPMTLYVQKDVFLVRQVSSATASARHVQVFNSITTNEHIDDALFFCPKSL